MTGMAAFFLKHRRRLALVMLAGGLFFALRDVAPRFPQETDLLFDLGSRHAAVVELRVAFLQKGEELAGASFSFPKGAPASVRHQVKLPSGEFDLWCELRMRSNPSRLLQRRLRVPVSGVVRVDLSQEPN